MLNPDDIPLTADQELFGDLQAKLEALYAAAGKRKHGGSRGDLRWLYRELHAIAAGALRARPNLFGKPRLA